MLIENATIAFCNYPFERLKIDSAGDCTFCCFSTRKCLGNILNQSLEEIWNGDLAADIRAETIANRLHTTCAVESCPFYHISTKLKDKSHRVRLAKIPIDIELDLPMQHCNIGGEDPKPGSACIMCERALLYHRQEDRVDEIAERLRPYADKFKFLHVQGVAEAFWKNKIFDVVEKVGVNTHLTRITTFTNGTILCDQRLDKWLGYPWSCTTFSIDASTPETYKKIRIWNAYDRIVSNMKEFARRRTPAQFFQIHNNINLLNVGEVKGMVELAAEVGVDNLTFNPTCNLPNLIVNEDNVHIFAKAQDEIVETALKLGVKVEFFRNLTLDLGSWC